MAEVTLDMSPKGCGGALQVEDRVDCLSRPIPAEENTAFWNPGDSAQESVPPGCILVEGEGGEAGACPELEQRVFLPTEP